METKLKNVGWVSIITTALLALTLLIVSGGKGRITEALADSAQLTRQVTVTVYLPLVARDYDPTYVSPFGIVMYGNVDDANGVQKMQEAGSKWVTTILDWSPIEPTRGGPRDWSSFDAKAQNAQAAGMEVFVLFTSNPSWAAALPGGPLTDTRDLVNFMALAAERYDCDGTDDAPGSPCVRYWSFYAEPDNGDPGRAQPPPAGSGKGYWGHNGTGYAAMLSQVSPAIHAANPQAQVLIGGLAYDYFEEDGGPFVRSFLTDTLTALNGYSGGAQAYIDAVAFHFYPMSAQLPAEKALKVRGIMERHGVGALPLLCPEMGYWSAEEVVDAPSSPEQQARRLVQMYVSGLSVDLKHMSWYAVFDNGIGTTEEHGLFWNEDLYNLNLDNPKPAYFAYDTMTHELAGARYYRSLQVANVEAYVFRMSDGRHKKVVWATASQATMSFPYPCLRRVDTFGNVQAEIWDGDLTWDQDQAANGQIVLRIEQDTPLYIVGPCY
jgi:hypothetical protein